jgi:hypothetical protein
MKMIRRTELVVKTHSVLIVRGGGHLEGWCSQCNRRVAMVLFDEEPQAGVSTQSTGSRIEESKLHLIEAGDGVMFLCLNSILESN